MKRALIVAAALLGLACPAGRVSAEAVAPYLRPGGAGFLDPRTFGAKFDGVTDDTDAINAAIAKASADGGGRVLLPSGQAKTGTLTMRSKVELYGSSSMGTLLLCAANPCIGKVAGKQLSGIRVESIRVMPFDDAAKTNTIFKFGTINQSNFENILIEGFLVGATGGTVADLGGEIPTDIEDTNLGWNITWNTFRNVTVYGCGTCWKLRGAYQSGPDQPDGNPPFPAQVLTHNTFDTVNTFYVNEKCISLVNSADTNLWHGGLCNLQGSTAIGVVNGDDPNYVGKNTWTGANKWVGFGFSSNGNAISPTLWKSINYTSAVECIGCETDISPALAGYTAIDMPYAKSYRICGKRLDNIGNDWLACQQKGVAWDQSAGYDASAGGAFTTSFPAPYNRLVIVGGSGTIAAATVLLPCGAPNELRATISSVALTVTALSVGACATETSVSVAGSPRTLSPTQPLSYRYNAGLLTWVAD